MAHDHSVSCCTSFIWFCYGTQRQERYRTDGYREGAIGSAMNEDTAMTVTWILKECSQYSLKKGDQKREGNLIKNSVIIILFWHTSWGRGYPTLLQWYRLVVACSQKCIHTGVGILRQHVRKMFKSASSLSNSSPLNHLDLTMAHSQEHHKVFELYMYRSSIRAPHHDWQSPSWYWL